ncbi:MAG: hypothetical protein HYZ95_01280, partial [Candidatus Omnitrophica bacterium]|nr:hypothetical protein [Candidatus Omnitrophota bacterium]
AMRIPEPARTKPLVVYGPKGLSRLYRRLNTAFEGWIAPKTYRLTLKEVGETTLRLPAQGAAGQAGLGGYTVRTKRMRHAGGRALGYRLQARGKSLAYSGDTDVCPAIVTLGRDADLLILECSVTDERKVAGHLTPTACGQIAALARCRHLLLTHFYPVFLGYNILRRVRRRYGGRLTLARDLRAFQL